MGLTTLMPEIEAQRTRVKGLEDALKAARLEVEILEQKLAVERDYLMTLFGDKLATLFGALVKKRIDWCDLRSKTDSPNPPEGKEE